MINDTQFKIMEIMEKENIISVKKLADEIGCSEMTIRRNLSTLESLDLVKKERGYAILSKTGQPTDYFVQTKENMKEKAAIASIAFQYIHPGQSICMDSGTTTQKLVELLPADISLSIITSSLITAMSLADHNKIQVLLPGGIFHHSNRAILFENPEQLSKYQTDIAFLTCRSFRVPGGSFEPTPALTTTKRALASIAQKKILLLDYSKWESNSLCNTFDMDMLDILITDDKAPIAAIEETAKLGKEILVVNPETLAITKHYNPSM